MQKQKLILYNIYYNQAKAFRSLEKLRAYLNKNDSGNLATIAKGDTSYLRINDKYTIFYAKDFTLTNVQNRLRKIQKGTRKRAIVATDLLNSNKLLYFNSMREAQRRLHVNRKQMSEVIHGQKEQAKGYSFKYQQSITIPDKLPEVQ